MSRPISRAAVLALGLVAFSQFAWSDTWTWDGQSSVSGNWSSATNWAGDTIPLSDPGTDLAFPSGGNSASVSNDLGTFLLRNLTISGSTALGFYGNPLQIYGSLVSESSGTCGMVVPILLGADAVFRTEQADLYIVSNVVNNGHTLSVEGNRQIIFMGGIAGSGGLTISNSGTAILVASNAYTGSTLVNGGTLQAMPASLSGTAGLTVQGSSTAMLNGATGVLSPQTQNHQVLVTGAGAVLNSASALTIDGMSNSLAVSAGGLVRSADIILGSDGNASHNAITVDGTDSRVNADNRLVMNTGTVNRLTVQNGGTVGASYTELHSTDSSILVSGSGSVLTSGYILVSTSAQRDSMEVTQGGTIRADGGIVLNGLANTVLVSGAGSTIRGPVIIGAMGAANGNHVEVEDGGRLEGSYILSGGSAASNTHFIVTGAGSYMGTSTGAAPGGIQLGMHDIVEVRDGGTVQYAPVWIGADSEVHVSGSGSFLGVTNGSVTSLMMNNNNLLTISNGATACLLNLQVAAPSNRILVAGANSRLLITGDIQQSGGSLLSVTDGAELRAAGISVNANDTVLVSGAGTKVTADDITSTYTVGAAGGITVSGGAQVSGGVVNAQGNLRVTSGGKLDTEQMSALGPAAFEVSGAGSTWSNRQDAMVAIERFVVSEGAHASVGGAFTANGATVLVHGAGTELAVASNLAVNGPRASITDGAHVRSQSSVLMTYTTLVSGTGTRWDMTGDLSTYGGHLTIENNAEVHNVNATVGLFGGVTATVSSATWSNSGTLAIINASTLNVDGDSHVSAAHLGIANGSSVRMDSGTLTARNLTATGSTLTVNGGTLNVSSSEYVSAVALQVGDGTNAATLNLTAAGGRHRIPGGLIINPNAELSGQGTIEGDVTVKGELSPGNSPGLLEVDGTLTLEQYAETLIELYGASASEYDRVEADTINYGGTLNIAFNFTPTNGQRFQVFTAGGYSGSFTSTNITGIYAGGFDATSGEVFVLQAIPEPSILALFALGIAAIYRFQSRPHRR